MGVPSARLMIDLDALRANYTRFQTLVGPRCAVAGIVKADAYGLGAEPVARVLLQAGCDLFFVATLDEALALRGFLAPEYPEIAVLGGLYVGAEKEYLANGLAPVLNTLGEVFRWGRAAPGRPAILHVDTGMNRLGLDGDEVVRLLDDPGLLCGVPLSAIMSHFACADEPDHPMTLGQKARFMDISAYFPGVKRSLSNSAGLFLGPAYHFDIVRPGIALYGGAPLAGRPNPMHPVVGLDAQVLQLRRVRKGETVGYGAAHCFEKDGFCATVALGYADGFLRSLSGRGRMFWKQYSLPIVGRVSMDLVTLDCAGIPDVDLPCPGDFVEIIGKNQSLESVASDAGTIPYEILTGMGARYHRVWRAQRDVRDEKFLPERAKF